MDPEQLLSGAREAITVRRVFGDPIEQDGVTIVPVASVRGGGGGGGDSEANGGGGFGLSARPVGVYVIREGDVTWRPAVDPVRMDLGRQVVAGLAVLSAWSILRRRRR